MNFKGSNTNFSPSSFNDEYRPGALTPAVQWLLAVNVGVYFIQLVLFGTDNIADWFGLSAHDFPKGWWSVGTYMFVHNGIMHLALNMFMLWMFGPRVEQEFGTRNFFWFYLWCGLGGAVFHLLFVREGLVVGASAAVVGVVLTYMLRWPDEMVYLFGFVPMRARWLAIWLIALNVGMAIADFSGLAQSSTAWMAHVGGLAFAWLYLNAPKSGGLDRIRRHVSMVPDDQDVRPVPRSPRSRRQEGRQMADDVVAKSNSLFKKRVIPQPQLPGAMVKDRRRSDDEVDALLDKISRQGMDSLTLDERKLLDEVSRRLRLD